MMRMPMNAQIGNDNAVAADSFQGGLADLESALMESNDGEYVIDELQKPKQQEMDPQMMHMLMMMMGGMG